MKDESILWFDLAQEDEQAAKILWENHRYGLAVFLYQQAVEKIIKAYIVEFKNQAPPKTHRIEVLVSEAGLDLVEIKNPAIEELSKAYIRVRYPDLNKQYFRNREQAQPLISIAGSAYIWVKNKLTNH